MFCIFELLRVCCPNVTPEQEEWNQLDDLADLFKPKSYEHSVWKAKVVRVLDGSTIQAIVKNEHQVECHRISLQGIAAPAYPVEVTEAYDQLQGIAKGSHDALKQKLGEDQGRCMIMFAKYDQYGRRHALVIMRSGENVCDWMVQNGYAVRAARSVPSSPTAQAVPSVTTPSVATL